MDGCPRRGGRGAGVRGQAQAYTRPALRPFLHLLLKDPAPRRREQRAVASDPRARAFAGSAGWWATEPRGEQGRCRAGGCGRWRSAVLTLKWGCTCGLGYLSARSYPSLDLCRVSFFVGFFFFFISNLSQKSVKRLLVASKKSPRAQELLRGMHIEQACRCWSGKSSEKGQVCPQGAEVLVSLCPAPAAQCKSPVRGAQLDAFCTGARSFNHHHFLGMFPSKGRGCRNR